MLSRNEWIIAGLGILLCICIFQKIKPNKEGFVFQTKEKKKKVDRKREGLEKMNENLEKDIERKKNKLNIEKYREDYENLLIALEEDIGNEAVGDLYNKSLKKSSRTYYLQQEGLNNLARYLKNYKD